MQNKRNQWRVAIVVFAISISIFSLTGCTDILTIISGRAAEAASNNLEEIRQSRPGQPESMSDEDIKQAMLESRQATIRASSQPVEQITARVVKRYYLALNGESDRLLLQQYNPATGEDGDERYICTDSAACIVFTKGYVVELDEAVVDRSQLLMDGDFSGYKITSVGKVVKLLSPEVEEED